MQHSLVKEHKAVISFIFIGSLLFVITLATILSSKHYFSTKAIFFTELNDAKGLSTHPLIYFKGIEIGRMESFSFDFQTNKIRSNFWILKEYEHIVTQHSILQSEQHPIFDEVYSFNLITPDSAINDSLLKLKEGSLVYHSSSEYALSLIAENKNELPKNDVEEILENINSLLFNLQQEDNPHAGSLFRALDRVAKISEQLLMITESIERSGMVDKADKTLIQAEKWITSLPVIVEKLSKSLERVDKLLITSENVINAYKSPEKLVSSLTNNQLPIVLSNINDNLNIVKGMLSDVHTERAQFMMTIYQSQQVLTELEKTLQALNNNPFLKGGIQEEKQDIKAEVYD